jgi:hypothetical protein
MDDGRNINIVTWGGANIVTDATREDPVQHQWVKKNTEPQKQFDTWKENETFKEARQEFLKQNIVSTSVVQQTQNPPMYEIISSMDHTNERQLLEKVSTINNFMQSCVNILNDPLFVKVLQNMLEICNIEV